MPIRDVDAGSKYPYSSGRHDFESPSQLSGSSVEVLIAASFFDPRSPAG